MARKPKVHPAIADQAATLAELDKLSVKYEGALSIARFDEEAAKLRPNPPDLDGDGKPGGSLSQLAWDTAQTAWGAVYVWGELKALEGNSTWPDLPEMAKVGMASVAKLIIDGREPVWPFSCTSWESEVRSKIFAAVVRSIAL